jgi:hypothetical protein
MAWRAPVSKREHASPTASAIFVSDLANQVFGGPSRPDDNPTMLTIQARPSSQHLTTPAFCYSATLSMPVGPTNASGKGSSGRRPTRPQWLGPMVPCRTGSAWIEACASPLGHFETKSEAHPCPSIGPLLLHELTFAPCVRPEQRVRTKIIPSDG